MKALLNLVFGFGLSLAAAFFAAEVYIRIYIHNSGTARAAHADDYGMAFYSLVIAVSAFCFVAITCMVYFAKLHNQKDRK